MSQPRVRESIYVVQDDPVKRKRLLNAFRGIQQKSKDNFKDQNGFFWIGGLHGEPFRGVGYQEDKGPTSLARGLNFSNDAGYWGGWCQHGNVLFPIWHRFYVLAMEEALRKIEPEVTLPFWDETEKGPDDKFKGVPKIFTDVTIDGEPNPLYSYKFPVDVVDDSAQDAPVDAHGNPTAFQYKKKAGYQTCRYPYSGIVYPQKYADATKKHNDQIKADGDDLTLLNNNVNNWLNGIQLPNEDKPRASVFQLYKNCLQAPNYTVFSNTTSAECWNDLMGASVVPLESPHNSIHLSVGGFDFPDAPTSNRDQYPFANGDMGENNTAGLDPIFFFHHCFVDYVFWLWQVAHKSTEQLTILANFAGTGSSDSQGTTPSFAPYQHLSMDSPMMPFLKPDGNVYLGKEGANIANLGYNYGKGSLDAFLEPARPTPTSASSHADHAAAHSAVQSGNFRVSIPVEVPQARKQLHVYGINRTKIPGSFVIALYENKNGVRQLKDYRAVLSRWNVSGCMNCQTHLQAQAHFDIGDDKYVKTVNGKNAVDPNAKVDNTNKEEAHLEVEVIRRFPEVHKHPTLNTFLRVTGLVNDTEYQWSVLN